MSGEEKTIAGRDVDDEKTCRAFTTHDHDPHAVYSFSLVSILDYQDCTSK